MIKWITCSVTYGEFVCEAARKTALTRLHCQVTERSVCAFTFFHCFTCGRYDPRPGHTIDIKNGSRCSSLGAQHKTVELRLVGYKLLYRCLYNVTRLSILSMYVSGMYTSVSQHYKMSKEHFATSRHTVVIELKKC